MMKLILTGLAVAIVALGSLPAWAGAQEDYEKGQELQKAGQASEALNWYKKAAEQGHSFAQNSLGVLYSKGEGGPVNQVAARKWFLEAAKQGNGASMYNLGDMYRQGKGVQPNIILAHSWLKKGAETGNAAAQHSLGLMYLTGEGPGGQNYAKAATWFAKAADQGHSRAQYNLAGLYSIGEGVAKNYETAAELYRLAAIQGFPDAQFRLAELYMKGEGVPQSSPRGVFWVIVAATNGHAFAANVHEGLRDRFGTKMGDMEKKAKDCIERNYENCG